MQQKILIIGAGLTGLTLAYRLKQKGLHATILEARERIGGRILTSQPEGAAPIELGATWLGKKHQALVSLLEELHIPIFQQHLGTTAVYEYLSTSPHQLVQLPPNDEPSFRIAGGSSRLINALANQLSSNQIQVNEPVEKIAFFKEKLEVVTNKTTYHPQVLISTLPPKLLVSSVVMDSDLPNELTTIAHQTHTWMGESIKVGLRFEQPFWRKAGLSGTIFSNVGPINEFYDHSNVEDNQYALKGFLNGVYHTLSREERKALVLKQLKKYYGEACTSFTHYEEAVWRKEPYTFANYESHILPHQNNGHPLFRKSYYNGQFFIGGSETAAQFPGYMDGAVRSAQWIYESLVA